jgi:uncharacterized repeat protein (TIGR01451 family)
MGFNPTDMFLYAINATNDHLIQIDSTGATTGLGAVTGLPILSGQQTYNSGSIGNCTPLNTLWVSASANTNTIYGINVTASPPTATALHLVNSAGVSTTIPNLADFVCQDGYLWGVEGGSGTTAAAPNGMYRINISSSNPQLVGQVDLFSLASLTNVVWNNSNFGAQWFYGNGNLGISNNATGDIYQIAITNPTSASPTFSEAAILYGPASTTNDGASYAGEPVDLALAKSVTTDYGPSGPGANNNIYTPGSNLTYSLVVTNNETTVTSSGFYITDTLDADIDPSTITFSSTACYISGTGPSGETIITCVYGTLGPGQSTPPFYIYATSPRTIGGSVANTATVFGNEEDPNSGNNTSAVTINAAPSGYIVSKSAQVFDLSNTPVAHARQGYRVEYTVTLTNTGNTDYTAAGIGLAGFTDNLADVFDDANAASLTYTDPGLSLSGNTLSWSGELLVGTPVTVTYSVVVDNPDTGNRSMNNSVVATHDEGGCGGVCTTQTLIGIPSYTVSKAVDKVIARPGDFVTYTLTITNTGTAPYTHRHPITITDNLSDVLDDAVYTGSINNGAFISGTTLNWSGPLAIGASTSVSYTVRVTNPTATGNLMLNNVVIPFGSDGTCAGICTTSTPVDTTLPPLPPVTPPVNPGVPGPPNTGSWLVR